MKRSIIHELWKSLINKSGKKILYYTGSNLPSVLASQKHFSMQENIWWHHLENNGARVLHDTGEDRRVIHTWIWAQGLLPLLVHPGWAALDSGAEPPRETPFAADLHCNTKAMKGQQSESSPTMGEEQAEASACCKIFTNFTMNIKWASNENWC